MKVHRDAIPGSVLRMGVIAMFCAGAAMAEEGLSPQQENALVRGESVSWPEMTPQQAQALHAKAGKYLDIYERYHLPHGLNADMWWHDYDRTSIYRLEGAGDSAAWTGHYLAALTLRQSRFLRSVLRTARYRCLSPLLDGPRCRPDPTAIGFSMAYTTP